jgi:hypothetical protein
MIPVASLNTIIDELCTLYSSLVGTSASDMGIGETGATYGAVKCLTDIDAAMWAAADTDFMLDFSANLNAARAKLTASKVAQSTLYGLFARLNAHSRRYGQSSVTNLNTLMTYLNCTHATKWQTLAASQWYELYYSIFGVRPAVNNVYFEVLQGATYANGLRKLIVATTTQTPGASIDSAKYCGGFPKIIVSGITGSGVVTVTGSQYNPATKTVTAGKTWTVTASADTTYDLAVGTADANSLIVAVSAISVAAGITAGTIYAEAHRPATRPLIS